LLCSKPKKKLLEELVKHGDIELSGIQDQSINRICIDQSAGDGSTKICLVGTENLIMTSLTAEILKMQSGATSSFQTSTLRDLGTTLKFQILAFLPNSPSLSY
jgi:hypothetical protein